MSESKHDKFVRLRDTRLPNALKQLELLTNLSRPSYDYSGEEAEELVADLESGVKEVAVAFGLTTNLKLAYNVLLPKQDDPIDSSGGDGPDELSDTKKTIAAYRVGVTDQDREVAPKNLMRGWWTMADARTLFEQGKIEEGLVMMEKAFRA